MEVEVYRLWNSGSWDTAKVTIEAAERFDIVESRAAQQAWLDYNKHPHGDEAVVQIGLYMPNYKGPM